jgi:hypothetical protein
MITARSKRVIKHIHEGRFAADAQVTLHHDGTAWDPTIDGQDVEKLDRMRFALQNGDIKSAANKAKVFELLALAGE